MNHHPSPRLLGFLLSLPALAQAIPAPKEPVPANITFKIGAQADTAQGKALHGKLTWNVSEALTLFIAGDQSTLASGAETVGLSGSTTAATTTSLGGDYAFGSFDLGLRYDQSRMSDLLASKRYALLPALLVGAWQFGIEFSTRTTDFDRIEFRNLPINTPMGPVYVAGYADLGVRDTGLGLSCDYFGELWRPYASYTRFRYGSFDGATDVTRIRNAAGMVSPEMFKALSARLVDRLERISASRLNRRAALLESTTTAGIEANLSRTRWGLEATRDVDHLTDLTADTYIATAAWKATPRVTFEVQAGAFRSKEFGTERFAGLTFLIRTRPSL